MLLMPLYHIKELLSLMKMCLQIFIRNSLPSKEKFNQKQQAILKSKQINQQKRKLNLLEEKEQLEQRK